MEKRKKAGRPSGTPESTKSDAMKNLRLALGLTQQQMAGQLGCSISLVVKCERLGQFPARGVVKERALALCKKHGIDFP